MAAAVNQEMTPTTSPSLTALGGSAADDLMAWEAQQQIITNNDDEELNLPSDASHEVIHSFDNQEEQDAALLAKAVAAKLRRKRKKMLRGDDKKLDEQGDLKQQDNGNVSAAAAGTDDVNVNVVAPPSSNDENQNQPENSTSNPASVSYSSLTKLQRRRLLWSVKRALDKANQKNQRNPNHDLTSLASQSIDFKLSIAPSYDSASTLTTLNTAEIRRLEQTLRNDSDSHSETTFYDEGYLCAGLDRLDKCCGWLGFEVDKIEGDDETCVTRMTRMKSEATNSTATGVHARRMSLGLESRTRSMGSIIDCPDDEKSYHVHDDMTVSTMRSGTIMEEQNESSGMDSYLICNAGQTKDHQDDNVNIGLCGVPNKQDEEDSEIDWNGGATVTPMVQVKSQDVNDVQDCAVKKQDVKSKPVTVKQRLAQAMKLRNVHLTEQAQAIDGEGTHFQNAKSTDSLDDRKAEEVLQEEMNLQKACENCLSCCDEGCAQHDGDEAVDDGVVVPSTPCKNSNSAAAVSTPPKSTPSRNTNSPTSVLLPITPPKSTPKSSSPTSVDHEQTTPPSNTSPHDEYTPLTSTSTPPPLPSTPFSTDVTPNRRSYSVLHAISLPTTMKEPPCLPPTPLKTPLPCTPPKTNVSPGGSDVDGECATPDAQDGNGLKAIIVGEQEVLEPIIVPPSPLTVKKRLVRSFKLMGGGANSNSNRDDIGDKLVKEETVVDSIEDVNIADIVLEGEIEVGEEIDGEEIEFDESDIPPAPPLPPSWYPNSIDGPPSTPIADTVPIADEAIQSKNTSMKQRIVQAFKKEGKDSAVVAASAATITHCNHPHPPLPSSPLKADIPSTPLPSSAPSTPAQTESTALSMKQRLAMAFKREEVKADDQSDEKDVVDEVNAKDTHGSESATPSDQPPSIPSTPLKAEIPTDSLPSTAPTTPEAIQSNHVVSARQRIARAILNLKKDGGMKKDSVEKVDSDDVEKNVERTVSVVADEEVVEIDEKEMSTPDTEEGQVDVADSKDDPVTPSSSSPSTPVAPAVSLNNLSARKRLASLTQVIKKKESQANPSDSKTTSATVKDEIESREILANSAADEYRTAPQPPPIPSTPLMAVIPSTALPITPSTPEVHDAPEIHHVRSVKQRLAQALKLRGKVDVDELSPVEIDASDDGVEGVVPEEALGKEIEQSPTSSSEARALSKIARVMKRSGGSKKAHAVDVEDCLVEVQVDDDGIEIPSLPGCGDVASPQEAKDNVKPQEAVAFEPMKRLARAMSFHRQSSAVTAVEDIEPETDDHVKEEATAMMDVDAEPSLVETPEDSSLDRDITNVTNTDSIPVDVTDQAEADNEVSAEKDMELVNTTVNDSESPPMESRSSSPPLAMLQMLGQTMNSFMKEEPKVENNFEPVTSVAEADVDEADDKGDIGEEIPYSPSPQVNDAEVGPTPNECFDSTGDCEEGHLIDLTRESSADTQKMNNKSPTVVFDLENKEDDAPDSFELTHDLSTADRKDDSKARTNHRNLRSASRSLFKKAKPYNKARLPADEIKCSDSVCTRRSIANSVTVSITSVAMSEETKKVDNLDPSKKHKASSANKNSPESKKKKKKKGWREYTDPQTGKKYYYNGIITTWTKPADFDNGNQVADLPNGESKKDEASKSTAKKGVFSKFLPSNNIISDNDTKAKKDGCAKKSESRLSLVLKSAKSQQDKACTEDDSSVSTANLTEGHVTPISSPSKSASGEKINPATDKQNEVESTPENGRQDSPVWPVCANILATDCKGKVAPTALTRNADTDTSSPGTDNEPKKKKKKKRKGWREYTDPNTGNKYYYNGTITTWEKPADFDNPAIVPFNVESAVDGKKCVTVVA